MTFNLQKSTEILERTPEVLFSMLHDLSLDWTHANEGGETWSPYNVVGHLIHGEKTDWIPRAEIILSDRKDKMFSPFDRFAQFTESQGKSMLQLLEEFRQLRERNISWLRNRKFSDEDLKKTGNHPEFGEVTLSHLLSTWVVHDLNHIAQISRVMASQYGTEVGPWRVYLSILGN